MFLIRQIDPKEIDKELNKLIHQGTIQTDYLKQIMERQNEASERLIEDLKKVHLKSS